MLIAMAAHPPRFGGKVASFDAGKALAVPGVRHVVQFTGTGHNFEGVAVLADHTWAARTGRDALQVQWDDSQAHRKGRSEEHTSELQSLMRISYAVFCLKKKKKYQTTDHTSHNTLYNIQNIQ